MADRRGNLHVIRGRLMPPPTPAARLWVTGSLRRPGRALALVLGLVAMTVATVASLVAGDALERLFVADAEARWGEVDVLLIRPGEPLIGESTARFAGRQADGPLQGFSGRLVLDAVATGQRGRRGAQAVVLGVTADEREMGPPLTGAGQVDPLRLGPEEVLLNRRLAEDVAVEVGDPVRLVIAIPEHTDPEDPDIEHAPRSVVWQPTVAGIADDADLADLGRTPNVITRLDTLQRVTELPGRVAALYVAGPDLPGTSAEGSSELAVEALQSISRQLGLVPVEVQQDALDIAEDEGGLFSGILLTLALLVVAAASVVTANLVVLLGQERAREIAVLRATGLSQAVVRRLLTAEALAYAVVAALIGVALAIPLAGLLARAVATNVAGIEAGRGRELVDLQLAADPGAIASGVLVVLLVAGLTARAAGRRIAALDVAEVLRGGPPTLPAPDRAGRRVAATRGAGLVAAGMALTAEDGRDVLVVLAAALLGGAWWLARRHRLAEGPARTALDERAACAGLVAAILAPAVLGDFAAGVQTSFGILTLAGVGAVACAAVLVTARMPDAMRLVRLYVPDGRSQATLRTAGSYAGQLRSRSGTVVVTIGVVVFMVAALAVLGSATDVGAARQRGGYDVVATSPVDLDVDQLRAVRGARVVQATEHAVMGESWFATEDDDGDASTVPYPLRAVLVDHAIASAQRFGLADALPEHPDAASALLAAAAGEGVVVDRYARPEGAQPGDDVVIDDGRGPVAHELLAVLDTYVLQGVLMGESAFDDLFARRGETFVLAATDEGASPAALAGAMVEAAAEEGLVASTVAEVAAEVVAVNRAFTDVFAILLQVGLAVALVAVGVLVARGSAERRGELAVLRAIGFRRRDVALVLLAEPVLQATLGILIGVVAGLGVLWLLFTRGFADLAFVVAWRDLALTSAGVVAAVVLAAGVPAMRGARRDVAAGLRDLG